MCKQKISHKFYWKRCSSSGDFTTSETCHSAVTENSEVVVILSYIRVPSKTKGLEKFSSNFTDLSQSLFFSGPTRTHDLPLVEIETFFVQ